MVGKRCAQAGSSGGRESYNAGEDELRTHEADEVDQDDDDDDDEGDCDNDGYDGYDDRWLMMAMMVIQACWN